MKKILLIGLTAVSVTAQADWYFRGTANDWASAAMRNVSGNEYQTCQSFGSDNPRFKIDRFADWSESYPSADYIVSADRSYNISFMSDTHAVTVTEVSTCGVIEQDSWYFRGTPNAWASTAMLSSDNITYCSEQSFGSDNPRFKIDHFGDWSESYPQGDFSVDADKTYQVCINADSKEISAVEVIQADTQPAVVTAVPAAGTYSTAQQITLSVSDNQDKTPQLYCTTDGSIPTVESTNCNNQSFSAQDINTTGADLLLKVFTVDASGNSALSSFAYTVIADGASESTLLYYHNSAGHSAPNIHYWDVNPVLTQTVWPGETLQSLGDEWYQFEFSQTIDSAQVIFNGSAGQTADLSFNAQTPCYQNNSWVSMDQCDVEDTKAPVLSAVPAAGSYEESTLTIELKADDRDPEVQVYYTLDGSLPTVNSTLYDQAISITDSGTAVVDALIKVTAVDNKANQSDVVEFSYRLNEDNTAPVISANPPAGHSVTPVAVTLNVSDNRDSSPVLYFTLDGSQATTESTPYYGQTFNISENTTINLLAADNAGNLTEQSFTYRIGEVNITRFDPRQETIYFLLTTRWFDGNADNTVGDNWCSWTEERMTDDISDDGFTGPEDVTWRGDFEGLVKKMDYIKALGFTAVWITPIVQNAGDLAYHGYHAYDFTKEDERLLSPGYDFQRVIDEAHSRDMKVYLDIVLNHTGRLGVKGKAEIKYNSDPKLFPLPDEWAGWVWDESKYLNGIAQFPNGWEYDGLTSPGTINGEPIPPYQRIPSRRPFTAADTADYNLDQLDAQGIMKYQWPSNESYVYTMDNYEGRPLSYDEYKTSSQWFHSQGFGSEDSFDVYPNANLNNIHEDLPDLNTENPAVRDYLVEAYGRYIRMGVDGFRVDTVMHIDKKTLNDMYWPEFNRIAKESESARGGSDFFMFGEVANFVGNITDKTSLLRQQNYTWDNNNFDVSSDNHKLNGNEYRTPDYSEMAPHGDAEYHFSVIDMVSHNGFTNGHGGGFNAALGNDSAYNDATFLTWYADSHDYGPNKGETRYQGDFAPLWSMLFTFRGIPIVYYGSEIRFAQGKPNDWPGGGANGVNMSLQKTGRSYFGEHLQGDVTASDFAEYQASGEVNNTLSNDLAQHLMGLNKIRHAVPALQMGQYSVADADGGWARYRRRYVGNVGGVDIDSFALVGVGQSSFSFRNVLPGTYIDAVTGNSITTDGGSISFNVTTGGDAGLAVYVLDGAVTAAPGKITNNSPFLN
ncbi:alpha-amylase family glycosyl hydrolase [Psychromonas aquimarina]|uniref:alpha-amylase family glycosyl hydrolase n=1 Tax=Psychromonas aquimarina TaxID=444919 RepID=UPI000415E8E7|nr:alpha-amylase family glycosyl hydrolase [Psychromonas aquimarina]